MKTVNLTTHFNKKSIYQQPNLEFLIDIHVSLFRLGTAVGRAIMYCISGNVDIDPSPEMSHNGQVFFSREWSGRVCFGPQFTASVIRRSRLQPRHRAVSGRS